MISSERTRVSGGPGLRSCRGIWCRARLGLSGSRFERCDIEFFGVAGHFAPTDGGSMTRIVFLENWTALSSEVFDTFGDR